MRRLFKTRTHYIWCPWLNKTFVVKHEVGNKKDTVLSGFHDRMQAEHSHTNWRTHKTFRSWRSYNAFMQSAKLSPELVNWS